MGPSRTLDPYHGTCSGWSLAIQNLSLFYGPRPKDATLYILIYRLAVVAQSVSHQIHLCRAEDTDDDDLFRGEWKLQQQERKALGCDRVGG